MSDEITKSIDVRLIDAQGRRFVQLVLHPEATVELFDGPWHGVRMFPEEALRLAEILRRCALAASDPAGPPC